MNFKRSVRIAVNAALFTYVATHYVAPFAQVPGASSDEDQQTQAAFDNAANQGTPCTLKCAHVYAVAGNRVQVKYGGYVGARINGNRFTPVWYPSNNGTAGNPIIFFAQYPAPYYLGNSSLWSELSRPAGVAPVGEMNNPIIGASVSDGVGRNYVIWDGFFINETESRSGPSAGCVQTQGGSTGVRYRRFLVHGYNLTDYGSGYNGNAFWLAGCTDVMIQDTLFMGDDTLSGNSNDACIETTGADECIVEHCKSVGRGGLVYFKGHATGGNGDCIGRYCWSESNGTSSNQNFGTQITTSTIFHHCFAKSPRQGLTYFDPAAPPEQVNVKSYNMTLVGTGGTFDSPIYIRARDTTLQEDQLYNSIVVLDGGSGARFCVLGEGNPIAIDEFDRYNNNVYYRFDGHTERWDLVSSSYTSLATYQAAMAAYGNDPYGRPYEADSIYADPLFVNRAAGDYRLQAGSPALTAGVGGAICGAFDGTGEVGLRANPQY